MSHILPRSAATHEARSHRPTAPVPPALHDEVTEIPPMVSSFRAIPGEPGPYSHHVKALVWRNVRVEHDAARLGSAWAVVRPLLRWETRRSVVVESCGPHDEAMAAPSLRGDPPEKDRRVDAPV